VKLYPTRDDGKGSVHQSLVQTKLFTGRLYMNPNRYKNFKKEFWEWFDELPIEMKKKFWYYKEDMSETNFYFSVYTKKSGNTKNNS